MRAIVIAGKTGNSAWLHREHSLESSAAAACSRIAMVKARVKRPSIDNLAIMAVTPSKPASTGFRKETTKCQPAPLYGVMTGVRVRSTVDRSIRRPGLVHDFLLQDVAKPLNGKGGLWCCSTLLLIAKLKAQTTERRSVQNCSWRSFSRDKSYDNRRFAFQ